MVTPIYGTCVDGLCDDVFVHPVHLRPRNARNGLILSMFFITCFVLSYPILRYLIILSYYQIIILSLSYPILSINIDK